ncbi:MAG: DNA polymerase I [Eubacterium sp.]|jgi:DNA polymerase-1
MNNGTIIIIDGNSLINRAYYAMQRPMITKDGVYTQGIYGFFNMLLKMLDDYDPGYIAVAWDRKTPTFRHDAYAGYKAGRRKMPPELAMEIPIMKDVLSSMNITNLEIDKFEADDIIGTVASRAEKEGYGPLIITGDRDALQLASDITRVLITKKGISEFELYDAKKVEERYEMTPKQFIDLKGLMGDSSDNIPGIPGVGEKTGIKLIKQFGSIEEMLTRTDEIKPDSLKEKVETFSAQALESKRLATIITEVPIEFDIESMKIEDPFNEKLVKMLSDLEFYSFLKRLHLSAPAKEPAKGTDRVSEITEKIEISDEKGLSALDAIERGSEVFIKVFSDGSHIHAPEITGISMIGGGRYYHINCAGREDVLVKTVDFLKEGGFKFSGHSLCETYYALMFRGMTHFDTAHDTEVAAYVIDPSKSNYSLKVQYMEKFGTEIPDEKEYSESTAQTDLFSDNSGREAEYGFTFLSAARDIAPIQREQIKKDGLSEVFERAELPLVGVLASMQYEGFRVDRDSLAAFGRELDAQIDVLSKEIYERAGEEFNINSPSQLGVILFEKMGLPAGKKTKTGYSTSADVLEKIRGKDPIVQMILNYRSLTKLKSTYVDGLIPLIGDGEKIRPHFRQTVAATGRISCTEPNLQNIPVRDEYGRLLRKSFIPRGDDFILVGSDYSQIELRVLAHLSEDENLIKAFNNGEDIHRATAARVFGIDYDKVTPLDRSRAKAVNFGVIYGMSGFGLSEELHISRKDAENYIKDYFSKHEAVKKFMDGEVASAKEKGYTTTILGRRRYIHELKSSNFMTRSLGERLAMNSPIQGSAADIIKLAMISVHEALRERGMKSRLILQVHDELILDVPEDEKDQAEKLLTDCMENVMELKVKLECSLNSGKTWYDLK